jgi:hypothetical protein
MKRGFALSSLAVLAATLLTPAAAAAAELRGVIELFTSQGCSSCPKADKLAGELANDPTLVVLSLPIDYWDYLGWKDTLAIPGHTNRQRAYAKARGDRSVYTPQVVINGKVHAIGSDQGAIERAVAQTKQQPNTLTVPVSLAIKHDQLSVTIGKGDPSLKGEVWLCPVTKHVAVAIGRGENSGHTVTYNNVVRRWVKIGEWTGAAQTFTVPLRDVAAPDIDAYAVVVQAGSKEQPGTMLGAAVASLK